MRIFVHNLEFHGAHGVYEEERRDGRRFQVDLSVWIPSSRADHSDALQDTLDYRDLSAIILDVAQGPSRSLIERLAHDILTRVLAEHAQVEQATVTIRKFATGVPGDPSWVGVELTRTQDHRGADHV